MANNNGWIPVTEALPERDPKNINFSVDILIISALAFPNDVTVGYYSYLGKAFVAYDDNFDVKEITFWRPMLDMPETDADNG